MTDRRTEHGEPLYTIDEARRELALLECARSGHSFEVLTAMGGDTPLRVFCSRCDKTWPVANDDRLRRALQALKSNVWRWEVPDDVREQVDAALAEAPE